MSGTDKARVKKEGISNKDTVYPAISPYNTVIWLLLKPEASKDKEKIIGSKKWANDPTILLPVAGSDTASMFLIIFLFSPPVSLSDFKILAQERLFLIL